ncbi:MAG: transporter ATP-binding protein [Anaerosolibacter sp.]|jgi:branched-chain amino acid transport system ATP-binding protein|uniref:ABC transporter ATP-binding protein n=1 Tax=Anaerosolibacter sp. TaxID=1872527 RepID=UPI002612307B|nr:ABC transporter ATP-binding protein [Anaerosolibacter sp.]MDF2548914.1 transporter ATP-binding protein [Anaerosolibacter sp.]
MGEPIIQTRGLTINFGGQTAVDHVTLDIMPNTFTSIIGPNGAGKTTFFNLISGLLNPSEGNVIFKGQDITAMPSEARVKLGMGRCFQITNVFPQLTALENVRLAVQAKSGVNSIFKHYLKYSELQDKAMEMLKKVNLSDKANSLALNLAHGDKRKLEIAIVLALEPEVLLLDEPTAGMSLEEVPIILDLLGKIKKEGQHTIMLVEHKIDMVLSLSDEIVVLFNGGLLEKGNPEDIMKNEQVQKAYLGGMS